MLISATISNCFCKLKIWFWFDLKNKNIVCNDGSNPCELDEPGLLNSYFLPINGYHCLDAFNGQIICTCPDNSTRRDRPCRKNFIFI